MRVIVTRPQEDSLRLAARLANAGHNVVLSPAIIIEPVACELPDGPFSFLIATSAHAFGPGAKVNTSFASLQDLPLHVVGGSTAQAARHNGFELVRTEAANAADLAIGLCQHAEMGTRVLYLAGEDRKPALEQALAEAGLDVATIVTYRAVAATSLHPEALAAIRRREADAVLHFSRRSAEIFAQLIHEAGLSEEARKMLHVCISADAADGLRELAPDRAIWPQAPGTDAVLELLDMIVS